MAEETYDVQLLRRLEEGRIVRVKAPNEGAAIRRALDASRGDVVLGPGEDLGEWCDATSVGRTKVGKVDLFNPNYI